MPIFEADFHPHSYGFRPKRNAHQALRAIDQAVWRGRVEILDADLSKYFDTIPHRNLMRLVAKRVSDGSVLRLVKSWLRAPVVERDKQGRQRVLPNRCGTPQGGSFRPCWPMSIWTDWTMRSTSVWRANPSWCGTRTTLSSAVDQGRGPK